MHTTITSRRGLAAAAAASALTVGALGTMPAQADPSSPSQPSDARAAAPSQVQAPVPTISWQPCEYPEGAQCAKVRVPLDYDQPMGAKTTLALLKMPATNQATKIGTLFVNPGGPGGSSTEFASAADQVFSKRIRARFDIVGIDPRGVGGSSPVVCRSDTGAPSYAQEYPANRKQERAALRLNRWLRGACRNQASPILDHMSTADTARDMDLIRQAVGDRQLTYYGVSYGTVLGATYANMFPGRVRALIVDGVVDPVGWYKGAEGKQNIPNTERIKSGRGAWESWSQALSECDRVSKKRCALTNGAMGKWRTIIRKARRGKLVFQGQKLSEQDITMGTLGAMYVRGSYAPAMRQLQRLYVRVTSTNRAVRVDQEWGAVRRTTTRDVLPGPFAATADPDVTSARAGTKAFSDPFHGVLCSDGVNPDNPRVWMRRSPIADRKAPWFGRYWMWASSTCAKWPGSSADAFRGSFTHRTSTPIVITGNLHDPATAITGARRLNQLMPGSRLITVPTWGHGAIKVSACVDRAWDDYLIGQKLPRNGLVCQPDKKLYPNR